MASHIDPITATHQLQLHLDQLQQWLKKWRIRENESKSTHITFSLRRDGFPTVSLNGKLIPKAKSVKYLGIHTDRRLTWKPHIHMKRKQLGLMLNKMYWIIGRKSKHSLTNNLLIYKAILKPIWAYVISLWGTASQSNIEILQRVQNKILRMVTKAPWYVPNHVLHSDLQIPTIREEITRLSTNYKAKRIVHPNKLISILFVKHGQGRLHRYLPLDLQTRFKQNLELYITEGIQWNTPHQANFFR